MTRSTHWKIEGGRVADATISRLAFAAALLLLEYLVIGLRHDGGVLARLPDWRSQFANIGIAVQLAATIGTALLILDGPALAQRVRRMQHVQAPVHRAWLVAHVLSFAALASVSSLVFSARPSAREAILFTGAWLLSGCVSLYSLARALFGVRPWRDLSGTFRGLWLAIPIAFVAWRLGVESWIHGSSALTRSSLLSAAALLRMAAQHVRVDVASELLVVEDFEVLIRPGCSGIDGMVLLGIFSSAYAYRFRKSLRFPQALTLIPLAVAAAWLTNIVRIAVLALIGAHWSPAVAAGGFHSKAGWLAFCALALGVVLFGQRAFALPRTAADAEHELHNETAVYCLPLVAMLSVGMLTTSLSATLDFAYAARMVVSVLVLYVFRDSYKPLLQAPSWMAVLLGAAVFGLWWLLTGPADTQHNLAVAADLQSLPAPLAASWLIARCVGSVLVVPVVEELAFRGYLLRRLSATTADFEAVSQQQISGVGWIASSLAFGCLHGQWIAGALAGAAYAGIMIWRGRLSDAVLAHACTNALLSLFVVRCGRWDLW